MRLVVTLAAALTVAPLLGCASSSEQEKSELNQSYVSCLKDEARRVDKGVGDAATVALAIWPACSQEFARVREALGIGAKARSELEVRFYLSDINFTTGIVLQARAEKE
jgi:hypothetical protein